MEILRFSEGSLAFFNLTFTFIFRIVNRFKSEFPSNIKATYKEESYDITAEDAGSTLP